MVLIDSKCNLFLRW